LRFVLLVRGLSAHTNRLVCHSSLVKVLPEGSLSCPPARPSMVTHTVRVVKHRVDRPGPGWTRERRSREVSRGAEGGL
jgi:hypothetical protein